MLLLKVVMYHAGDLPSAAAAASCCESTNTSNHRKAAAAPAGPSKKLRIASMVCANGLLQVWLTNHVAAAT